MKPETKETIIMVFVGMAFGLFILNLFFQPLLQVVGP